MIVHVHQHHRPAISVECNEDDTIGELKNLVAAKLGKREIMRICRGLKFYGDEMSLRDSKIHDGSDVTLDFYGRIPR